MATEIDGFTEWEIKDAQSRSQEIARHIAQCNDPDFELIGRNLKVLDSHFEESHWETLRQKRSIDLSYNNLSGLPDRFATLDRLEYLNLSYNCFKGSAPELLQHLTSLKTLKMNMNAIVQLGAQLCSALTQLRVFQIAACSVAELPEKMGQLMTNLTELTISQNGLSSIDPLFGTNKLTKLLSYMNSISELPAVCCKSWKNLVELQLTANLLTAVPDEISEMKSLEILDLSSNLLHRLPKAISECTRLRRLNLANNTLVEFPPIQTSQTALEHLDLSNNRIEYIFPPSESQEEQTVCWPRLEELILSKNKLRLLPVSILLLTDPAHGVLRHLSIEHNRLTQIPTIPDQKDHLRNLCVLNYKLNRFISIPPTFACLDPPFHAAFLETIPNRVVEELYIGSMASAKNYWALHAMGITHIINAAFAPSDLKVPSIFVVRTLNLQDSHQQPLLSLLPEVVSYISAVAAKGGSCLVHCQAGISRSAAVVLSYLMYSRKWSLDFAYEHLTKHRPVASPNLHFWSELQRYERLLFPNVTTPTKENHPENSHSCEDRPAIPGVLHPGRPMISRKHVAASNNEIAQTI